jgi:SAM-dependent methyltransferase
MSKQNEYPDFFARFYDTIYDSVRSDADFAYFQKKIAEADGPVLEVGVGTGRFFIEALKRGADIYGVDVSPSMIKILKTKLAENQHHRVEVQDICNLTFKKKFKLIIAPFRVFMHLIRTSDQLSALEKVHEVLLPGGTFIFDLFVPNFKLLYEGLDNFKDFEGDYAPGKKLARYTYMKADPVNQISHLTFRLVWDEDDGLKEEEWKTELRFFFRYELEHLLHRSIFNNFHIYGGFDESELKPNSKEFIIICKKE